MRIFYYTLVAIGSVFGFVAVVIAAIAAFAGDRLLLYWVFLLLLIGIPLFSVGSFGGFLIERK